MAALQVVGTAFFLAVGLFVGCEGFGSGAPAGACTTIQPGHVDATNNSVSLSAQTSTSPYSIQAGATSYQAGGTVTVQIMGPVFRGFLLQARRPGMTTPVGTFSNAPNNTKTTTCTTADSSMTHDNTEAKENITLTWTAPSPGVGNVQFVATVAQDHDTYWMNLASAEIAGGVAIKATCYVIVFSLISTAYSMLA
ncbi:PREDICTED: putative defense protein 3 [Branchiostoma belcheri]|uniref:Defense protein 3 n=1 Tax=Branchiostoma belcheri TaxID=7741 RepID=A0A6P4XBS9_BRABE|nr:PREDICTED: putative defense protein 3 [Branchiostoma belcheri]